VHEAYRERERVQIYEKLWSYWDDELPREVVGNLLIAGYEVGQYYCCKREWNIAESFLTAVHDRMSSVDSYIEQLSIVHVLRALGNARTKPLQHVLEKMQKALDMGREHGDAQQRTYELERELSKIEKSTRASKSLKEWKNKKGRSWFRV